jgi:hypothetical protein
VPNEQDPVGRAAACQCLSFRQSPPNFRSACTALDAYAAATGLQVLYDGALAAGRRSNAVSGVLMPDVALRVLLEETGLSRSREYRAATST